MEESTFPYLSILSNVVTIIGFPIALAGLWFVARQMKSDRLAVSAGAIGAMRASIMERVDRLHAAKNASNVALWEDEFKELANDLEMACAIYLDGQMSGRTGRLAKNLICDFLQMINDDEDLRMEMEKAIHAPDTFTNIRDFRAGVKRHASN
ncbi:hypothetical protein AB4Z34_07445 [Ensifer sp. 2YAB10]|uniref:hypothetical protein n=1 Tax=unclassified Ensifer TaxID=2633371 RepID=UPI003F8DC05A